MKELRLRQTGPLRPAVAECEAGDKQQVHKLAMLRSGVYVNGSTATVGKDFRMRNVKDVAVTHADAKWPKRTSLMQFAKSFDSHPLSLIRPRSSVNIARFGTAY